MKVYDLKPALPGGVAIVLMLVLWSASLPAAPDDASLQPVESWLEAVRSLEGDFDQVLLDESGAELARSTGTMALKRPGLFRWQYDAPTELLVVSDGVRIFSYDVELENVTIMQQTDALRGNPAALLAGSADVTEGFAAGGAWRAGEIDWIELLPRDSDRDFQSIRLGFSGQHLAAMELHDQLGQVTRIAFSNLRDNVDIADDRFVFVIPEGVDVINNAAGFGADTEISP